MLSILLGQTSVNAPGSHALRYFLRAVIVYLIAPARACSTAASSPVCTLDLIFKAVAKMKSWSVLVCCLGLSCSLAQAGDNTTAGVGGALGGVLGTVVGQQVGGTTGATIGAGLGGAAGSAVGANKNNRAEAAVGGGLGAAGGQVLGTQVGGTNGGLIGAGVGGAAGGALGNAYGGDDGSHSNGSSKKHKKHKKHHDDD